MSFRFFQVGTVFLSNDGLVLAGGSLTFTDSGTTNPRTTWSDPGMMTPNPNPVPLDGAGRPNNDIWGDGSYRVVLKDALGATLVTLDNVSGPVGIPNPALQSGEFLTNDGTNVFWAPIRQVPDPTGQPDGNVLTTDGAGNIAWEALPTTRQVPDPNAVGVVDGWVLTRDDASPGDYAWMAPVSSSLGVGQLWTTPVRAANTTYTNTTGRPIQVSVSTDGGALALTQFLVGGVLVARAINGSDMTVCVVVPDETTYRLETAGATTVQAWAELA